jgi:hypothetical protein
MQDLTLGLDPRPYLKPTLLAFRETARYQPKANIFDVFVNASK